MLIIHDNKFEYICNECGKKFIAKKTKKIKTFDDIVKKFYNLGWAWTKIGTGNKQEFKYFCPKCKDEGKKKIREIKINEIHEKLKRMREAVI